MKNFIYNKLYVNSNRATQHFLLKIMESLEKKTDDKKTGSDVKKEVVPRDSYYKPRIDLGAEPFAIASIILGTFMSTTLEEIYAQSFGWFFIAAGLGTLWAEGYSPIKIGKELLELTGKLACYPYDYVRKKYEKKEK